jgi:uncharacterized membrane protein
VLPLQRFFLEYEHKKIGNSMNHFKANDYFSRPASVNKSPLLTVVSPTCIVFFLLSFFQPFGLGSIRPWSFFWFMIAGFTMITGFTALAVAYLFPRLFKKFYNPETWTVGKNLINAFVIILLISLGNFTFYVLSHRQSHGSWGLFLIMLLFTVIIGVFPAIITFFILYNRTLMQNLHDAESLNKQLTERLRNQNIQTITNYKSIVLKGDTKESVELCPEDILYLETSGNYVKVFYLSNNIIRHRQLRTTISQIEKELQQYAFIVRCHRAFMVNTNYIVNLKGNMHGFQLNLRLIKEEVPVSRTYTKSISDKLAHLI